MWKQIKTNTYSFPAIALVLPPCKNMAPDVSSIPLGLAWLSSWLKQNEFMVECFDFTVQKEVEEKLIKGDYPIICVQLHSEENYQESVDYVRYLRSLKKTSTIIVGGIAATLKYKDVISEPSIDFLVWGEGEIPLVQLLNYLIKDKAKPDIGKLCDIKGLSFYNDYRLIFTGKPEIISDLNTLPMPDRFAFPSKCYRQWSIITARGCPFRCSFCTIPLLYEGRCRLRSAENIFQEIKMLRKSYGLKEFLFLDDTFTLNKERVMKLCSMLTNWKNKFRWSCFTRADKVDRDLLESMYAAGCKEISYGVESINQKTLDLLNKNLLTDQIENALKLTQSCGMRRRASFIFGLPNENYQDIVKTINFICSIAPEEVQIYPLMPYTGTPILNDEDIINFAKLDDSNGYKKNAFNPLVNTKSISKDEMDELLKICIDRLKKMGFWWVPGDIESGKHGLNKVVMTEFCPTQ